MLGWILKAEVDKHLTLALLHHQSRTWCDAIISDQACRWKIRIDLLGEAFEFKFVVVDFRARVTRPCPAQRFRNSAFFPSWFILTVFCSSPAVLGVGIDRTTCTLDSSNPL